MKFYTVAAAVILLATSAIAAPASNDIIQELTAKSTDAISEEDLAQHIQGRAQTQNWAGAVLTDKGLSGVTGTFIVPSPKSPGTGAVWVGIDGATCTSSRLRVGISWKSSGSGFAYSSWYEWSDDRHYFNIPIKAGDKMILKVSTSSNLSGDVSITNYANGRGYGAPVQSNSHKLCNQNAEWVVDDFGSGDTLSNFGTITFTDAIATKGGISVGPEGAEIYNFGQANNRIKSTRVSIPGHNTVAITHI